MTASVRAVVVRWRGGDEVRRCLTSLQENGGPHLNHIVLVDSGSGDGGAERLRSVFSDVEVMALPDNRGFAFAAGCGASQGPESLILLLNPDIEIEDGTIDQMVATIDARPRCAGVVPSLFGPDGQSQYRWQLRKLPTTFDLALGRPGKPAFRSRPAVVSVVQQPAAAAWLVRRSVWQTLGGLDPTFEPAWWEDVDFCARLDDRLGDRDFPADEAFIVDPHARMLHLGGSSVAALGRRAFLSAFYSNLLRFTARHHPGRLGWIRRTLQLSIRARLLLRPADEKALQAALRTIRKATP